jgi:hypothetical protein
MRPSFKTVSTAALGLAMAFSAGAPAIAFPLTPVGAKSPTLVETVQYRSDRDRVWDRDHDRREYRHDRRREAYFKGYRGHRDQRPGYRRHSDGWWYPLAAFGAAAVIGNAIVNQPTVVGRAYSNRHVEWCSERFRTYRVSDNTYIPSAGFRAQCNSPFNR